MFSLRRQCWPKKKSWYLGQKVPPSRSCVVNFLMAGTSCTSCTAYMVMKPSWKYNFLYFLVSTYQLSTLERTISAAFKESLRCCAMPIIGKARFQFKITMISFKQTSSSFQFWMNSFKLHKTSTHHPMISFWILNLDPGDISLSNQ